MCVTLIDRLQSDLMSPADVERYFKKLFFLDFWNCPETVFAGRNVAVSDVWVHVHCTVYTPSKCILASKSTCFLLRYDELVRRPHQLVIKFIKRQLGLKIKENKSLAQATSTPPTATQPVTS